MISLTWVARIGPGRVFDLCPHLYQVAKRRRAMDERRAIQALLMP